MAKAQVDKAAERFFDALKFDSVEFEDGASVEGE
jgi:hypothetical protein